MKNKVLIIIFVIIAITTIGVLIYRDKYKMSETKKSKLVVDVSIDKDTKQGSMFIGSSEEASKLKESDKLIDPVIDIATNAEEKYKKGNYAEAEKEALRAISLANHGIVKHIAHNTLLKTYEATNNYSAAITEIDWLLNNVNEQTKIGLIEKKKKFEELSQKSSQ
ncbi:MAG: hypothetical protein M1308_14720 [Actinobacteria bacterium]|nr:hypothetical protein [Actinomycetota bacterium]